MILRCHGLSGNILAAGGVPSIASTSSTPIEELLVGIDWSLSAAALLAGIVVAIGRRSGSDGAPPAAAPLAPHRIREDAVLMAMGVYLLASALLSLAALSAPEPSAGEAMAAARTMLLGSAAQLIGAGACLIIARMLVRGGIPVFLRGHPSPDHPMTLRRACSTVGLTTLLAIGLCPLITHVTLLATRVLAPDASVPTHPTLEALGGGSSPVITVALWIGAAIIAPAAEELFFRGLILNWLADLLRSSQRAILLSAVAFGLVHSGQFHTVPALIFFGLLLGRAYVRAGNLLVPILIHALFNLKTLTWNALLS